MLRGCRLTLI